MSFENEALVEKAPVLPDAVQFDSVFSNDLAEEQDFDLCFGAEEDDALISMVSQDELFTEAGYEIPFESLNEEDEEDLDREDKSSSDVEDSESDGSEDSEEPVEEPVEQQPAAPTVQVNVDAEDVNITAEAPSNESYGEDIPNLLDLDEDEISIDHADTVNITPTPETTPAPETEPAAVPAPSNDDIEVSGPTAVAPDDAVQGDDEPENLLDDPEDSGSEEPAPEDDSDSEPEVNDGVDDGDEEVPSDEKEDECGASCAEANLLEEEDDSEEDNTDIEVEEKCNEANLLEYEGYSAFYGDTSEVPYEEIPGTTDTPNLLEADDISDPTLGEAPDGQGEMIKTPAPSHDTSSNAPIEDEPKNGGETEAMKTVDDLGFAEANLLEADEDPQENATEEDAEGALDMALASDMLGGVDGVTRMWNSAPTFDDDNVVRCQKEYQDGDDSSVPNLLEADADTNFDGIEEKDNENHFNDDLAEPLSKDLEKVMDNAPEDSTKREEGIEELHDNEKGFEDLNLLEKDPESMMNNAPVDSSKKDLGIPEGEDTEDNYKDDLAEPFDKDVENIINRAPEDSSKEDKGGVQEANLLEEDEYADVINGIMQADNSVNDTSKYSAIDKDPDFPVADALINFDNIEEANLLEDDADTNFDGIEDEKPQESKASSYEVIPDAVAIPAEDRDQDGLKAEVNGPIETGDDEKINTVAEADYMDQVKSLEDDNVFYDSINTGLETPPNLLDTDDEDIIDDLAAEEA